MIHILTNVFFKNLKITRYSIFISYIRIYFYLLNKSYTNIIETTLSELVLKGAPNLFFFIHSNTQRIPEPESMQKLAATIFRKCQNENPAFDFFFVNFIFFIIMFILSPKNEHLKLILCLCNNGFVF